MKILFVLNDNAARIIEYEHTGVLEAPCRRAVEIELTEDQVEKIGLRKIGSISGDDVFESIESISLIPKP